MQVVPLHEPVKVRVDFGGGEARPLRFRRGIEEHHVVRVNARWHERTDRRTLRYFSITADTGDVYLLCFHAEDMIWYVESVSLDS
ncbi:MAG: hypothetical protein L0216_01235 [Planctomycetales bacterium]|nr:hypothetical protein [Planctomycetales bacterium]